MNVQSISKNLFNLSFILSIHSPQKKILIIFFTLICLSTCFFITPTMAVGSCAYLLMFYGMLFRKINFKAHVLFMATALLIDFMIVLLLQIKRSAIPTALRFELNIFQQLHILSSSLALICYFPIICLGIYNLTNHSNSPSIKKTHKYLGLLAFLFRTLSYFFMFSMLWPH